MPQVIRADWIAGETRRAARGRRARGRGAPARAAAAVLARRRPARADAAAPRRSSSRARRCRWRIDAATVAGRGAAHAHRGRHLERRPLHALRRAARRRAPRRAAAAGRRHRHASSPPTPTAPGEADALLGRALAGVPRDDYALVGAIGHDFYEGEREGAKGFPRFTDPRLRGPDGYADYVRMAAERSLERCGADALRPAAPAQPRPHRLHQRGGVGRAGRRSATEGLTRAPRRRARARPTASRSTSSTASSASATASTGRC